MQSLTDIAAKYGHPQKEEKGGVHCLVFLGGEEGRRGGPSRVGCRVDPDRKEERIQEERGGRHPISCLRADVRELFGEKRGERRKGFASSMIYCCRPRPAAETWRVLEKKGGRDIGARLRPWPVLRARKNRARVGFRCEKRGNSEGRRGRAPFRCGMLIWSSLR